MFPVLVGVCATAQTLPERSQAQLSTFRVRTTLIPVDVRVIDGSGAPVSGLTQADFTVLEDGRPQPIRLFWTQGLGADQASAEMPPDRIATVESRPQTGRTFLVALGRTWLPRAPFETLSAITHFMRESLLRDDRVAVSAWNRATDFSTDHELVARVVERLAQFQKRIDDTNDQDTALALVNWNFKPIPSALEAQLDAVFRGPTASPFLTSLSESRPEGRNLRAPVGSRL